MAANLPEDAFEPAVADAAGFPEALVPGGSAAVPSVPALRAAGSDALPADALAALHPAARRSGSLPSKHLMAALLVVAALVAAAVTTFVLAPRPGELTVTAGPAATGDASQPLQAGEGAPGEAPPESAVFVHVDGAVRAPGLYRLAPGARIIDAISAAGGFAKNAERAAVNLARPVSDGEQILVPTPGAAVPAAQAGPGAAAPAAALVNLNTATADQLESLPRVGPALAERILAWRAAHGRFNRVEDLLGVTGIGAKTFAGLRDRITV